ncbi:MAG: VOC family protein [Gemmatimonadetes bacterium]|nr:VOC family protein [Gemmatimonadota bacterium]
MKKIQVQGVHHTTIVGPTRQSAIDFWEGARHALHLRAAQPWQSRGEPLYFDPGDGRLLTVFTNESRADAGRKAPREVGSVDHLAFNVSRATFAVGPQRLRDHGVEFYERDRGFMNSIYLRDPNGLLVELACYKFEVPEGYRAADVMIAAHRLRVARGDHHIVEEHLADALEQLLSRRDRLSREAAAEG